MLNGCYTSTLPLPRGKVVFSLFRMPCYLSQRERNIIKRVHRSRYCCHMGETLPGNWKTFVFLVAQEKCSPSFVRETLPWPRGRNAPRVQEIKYDSATWQKGARVLQTKSYLYHTTWTIFAYYTRKNIWPHGINVPLVLLKKCDFWHIAEILYIGCESSCKFWT